MGFLIGLVVGVVVGIFAGYFLNDCRASAEPLDPEQLERLKKRVR